MKRLISLQLLVTVLFGGLITLCINSMGGLSVVIGGLLMGANLWSHFLVWTRFIQKKLIALALGIIVFKYAILGIIIYKILTLPWISIIWFGAGVGSLMITSLFYSLFFNEETKSTL